MRFLVVDDNPQVAGLLKRILEDEMYEVDVSHNATDARNLAYFHEYDSIILDRMLPDGDGLKLCAGMRKHGIQAPILMLTAMGRTEDKVEGLDAGADDYMTKPFEIEEFLARTRNLLKRRTGCEGMLLKFDELELDMAKRIAVRAGKPIGLTAKEYAILEYFLRTPNVVLSRARIGEHVWGIDFEESSNVIEVYISRLRSKIDKNFTKPLLHTVIGMGYILSEDGPPGA